MIQNKYIIIIMCLVSFIFVEFLLSQETVEKPVVQDSTEKMEILDVIETLDTNIQLHLTNAVGSNEVVSPDDELDTIFNDGLTALQKGDYDEAISQLEKLLSYNTDNPDYYIYLGYTYYVHGNYDKAVEVLNKSLEFDDTLLAAHVLLGEIYYQLNQILKARDEFENVIILNENIKLAHIRLYELFKDNNPVKANQHYLRIFHLPTTKLEKILPDIEKVGNIKLPFNKNLLILKNIGIDSKLKKGQDMFNDILQDETAESNEQEIIVSINQSKLNLNMKFLLNPLKTFDAEKFYIKIIELIFVSVFLLIYSLIMKRKDKKLERIVLNQYRINIPGKKE